MITPPDLPEGSGLWGMGASALALFLYLRKKLSRDKVDIHSDEAQINLVKSLQQERDHAIKELGESRKREESAWLARNEDARLIGKLNALVEHQSGVIARLEEQVAGLRADLHNLRDGMNSNTLRTMVREPNGV